MTGAGWAAARPRAQSTPGSGSCPMARGTWLRSGHLTRRSQAVDPPTGRQPYLELSRLILAVTCDLWLCDAGGVSDEDTGTAVERDQMCFGWPLPSACRPCLVAGRMGGSAVDTPMWFSPDAGQCGCVTCELHGFQASSV
jgi:hypothetical protein